MYKGIIYKYTSPSNKIYIGQTINEYSRRNCFLNINHLYAGGKIDNARRKYGPKAFIYEIIEVVEKESPKEVVDELNRLEEYYIDKYDSINTGYNTAKGGINTHTYKSKTTKDRISEAKSKSIILYDLEGKYIKLWPSARIIEEELGIKAGTVRKCCSGSNTHASCYIWRYYDNIIPYEIEGLPLKKIDAILKSKDSANSTNGRTFKKILLYSLDGKFLKEFSSIIEASEKLNISSTLISLAASGKFFTSGGFIWRYYTDNYPKDLNLTNELIMKYLALNAKIGLYDKDNNLIAIYDSIKDANIKTRHDKEGISKACKLLILYCNYYWKYEYVRREISKSNN